MTPPRSAFDVPGVRSISADIHKYGYAPKGASLVCYADADDRAHQYFATADWTGYPVANPVLASTRSGGPMAAAWAVVEHLGTEGYRAATASAWAATRTIVDGWPLPTSTAQVVVEPDGPLFAVTSANVFRHAERMRERGWMTTRDAVVRPVTRAPAPDADRGARRARRAAARRPAGHGGRRRARWTPSPLRPRHRPRGPARRCSARSTSASERTLVDATMDALDPATRAMLVSAYMQSLFT